jgi:hypothetical protein
VCLQLSAAKQTHGDLSISHVEGEQHGRSYRV